MDKETLSNYGWIVICVLVLAVMLAFAGPFGNFIADAIKSTTQGLFDVNQGALDAASIQIREQEFDTMLNGDKNTQVAGLYKTGTNYTELVLTWDELINNNIIYVENGAVFTIMNMENGQNSSSSLLAGDLMLPTDGSITSIGNCVILNSETGEMSGNVGFGMCAELTGIKMPECITKITPYAFAGCSKLTNITIPNKITSIDEFAFGMCTGLKQITIPDNVATIGEMSFYGCTSLDTITFGSNSKLKTIERNAFQECFALKSISLPEGLTHIGYWAFAACVGLEDVYIPSSVTSMCEETFMSCDNLKSVIIMATTPPTVVDFMQDDSHGTPFLNSSYKFSIYVPSESINTYKSADIWSRLTSYVEFLPIT